MKARWSIPQRQVRTATVSEAAVVEDTTEDETPQVDKVSKPAKAKTTSTKKQEK